MQQVRKSGILLHPTSLPGLGGIGSLGAEARIFVDFLRSAGQSLWQVLPLGPVAYGNSPYSCYSAFAGNPLLIDLHALVAEGDLAAGDLEDGVDLPADHVDFPRVGKFKTGALRRAASRFFEAADHVRLAEFRRFCENSFWLHDYALFMAVKESYHGKNWTSWPDDIARRRSEALAEYSRTLDPAIAAQKYAQWQFSRQWQNLKGYANSSGVDIIGDLPIFVAFDSADVWANPHLFQLDEHGSPTAVAGVPPDYFSKTGQLWGNPLYDWEMIAGQGYGWWIDRMKSALAMYDLVRVDHFRGFEAYWQVPASDKTAERGHWIKGPGADLFNALTDSLGTLPIIAEDLGVITPEVEELRDSFGFPGMKVLQFAFGSGPSNPYLPHNYLSGAVVYTGTHDNETTSGWFSALSEKDKKEVLRYIGSDGTDIVWDLIRLALASVADRAVVPLQDVLGLGSPARMNVPGTPAGNWSWRFLPGLLDERVAARLLDLTEVYGRNSLNRY